MKKKKEYKPVAYKDGTYAIEPNMPYPVILYPSFYGFPFSFKQSEDHEECYLCNCSRNAVEKFIQIINVVEENPYNIFVSYRNQFPLNFLNYIEKKYHSVDYGYILSKYSDELYKAGLCHYCNKTTPSYAYCVPMYGSKFVQQYGWYRKMKQIEFGLYHDSIVLPDSIPNELKECTPKLDPQSLVKLIKDYSENVARANWNVKPIGKKWDTETKLFDYVNDILHEHSIIFHYRPNWLENLELDIYIEDINVGIEYQGIQHYKPMKHWGGEEAFLKRRINDIRKKHLCELHGTALIEFSYMDTITEELVKERLSKYINGGP